HRPHLINFSATCDKGIREWRSDFFEAWIAATSHRAQLQTGGRILPQLSYHRRGKFLFRGGEILSTSARRPHSGLNRSAALRGITAGYAGRAKRARGGNRPGHPFRDGRGDRGDRL